MNNLVRALVAVVALAPVPARAADPSPYVSRVAAFGFSGQIVVAVKGRVVLDRSLGLADKERLAPVLPDTVFNVASFTKQFTAAAVLRLEMDGKLSVGDRVSKYLDGVPEDKAAITIHQLLTHTAGLRRDTIRSSEPKVLTRDETVRLVLASPLSAKPGEGFHYSNDGYRLLAAIVETASGEPFGAYLAKHLFEPAGMRNTGMFDDPRWAKARVAKGYDEWHALGSFLDWPKSWHRLGPGGVVSTARDLFRWHLALSDERVLSAAEKAKMTAKQTAADDAPFYGYGWFITETADKRPLLFHGGDNLGYHSEFRWYPADDRVIVVVTNQDRLGIDGGAVQKRVVANAISKILSGAEPPAPPETVRMTDAELRKFAGDYPLEDGSQIRVWFDAGHLVAGADGQAAIDRLAGLEPDPARTEANRRAAAVLEAVIAGKLDDAKKVLPDDQFKVYVPFLADEIRTAGEKLGAVRDVKVRGTVPIPWDEQHEARTYAVVTYERGSLDLFLGWTDGALGDVTTGEGRPYPVILPVAPVSKTELASWDLITSRSARITRVADRPR
jgi:CubicO group peptidase (beta-lactamase class C family)